MKKAIEQHHISYEPEIKVKIARKEHQKIHGTEPIDTPLSREMRKYDAVTKILMSYENWKNMYEIDFCELPDMGLTKLKKLKSSIHWKLIKIIREDAKKTKHIKGLGEACLAGILAYAHPNRFSSLHKFLIYCGYKYSNNHRFSRQVKPWIWNTVDQMIRKKDDKYYELYKDIKKDLSKKYPEYSKGKIDGMTRNRVGTFLLKEIYQLFCNKKEMVV